MNTLSWILVAFAAGVLAGATLRESHDILTGKRDPMVTVRRALHPRVSLLVAMLILSMLFVAAVGVGIIVKDSSDRAAQACQVEFNEKTAAARDARVAISTSDVVPSQTAYVEADLEYQRGLLEVVSTKGMTVDDLAAVISTRVTATATYLDALEAQAKVAERNPYPPADYCTGSKR
jgi:hypothetical protein